MNWNKLNQLIQQLKKAKDSNDFNFIRSILQSAVTGYFPQCEIVDEVTLGIIKNKTVSKISNVIQI